jgi:cytochrome c nitrite reductase small subunit
VAPAFVAASLGVFAGTGVVTFRHAEGLSYLSSDPRACVNCHIMRPQYDSWQKASHHHWARCVDCHLPHDLVGKYVAKARNGWFHSKGFTLQDFPEPIVITPPNARILQANCVACHDGITHAIGQPECVHCHADVGHGAKAGLGGPFHEEEIAR